MAGAAALFGFEGLAARPRPGRRLPPGAPLLHRGAHPVRQNAECRDYGGKGHEKAQASPGMVGIGSGAARVGEASEPHSGERDDQAEA
jgi:hypothetical protein